MSWVFCAAATPTVRRYSQLQLGTGKTAGLVGGKTCVSLSVCPHSALRLAISRQRVVRSTSSLACGRGPPGPRMCRDSAESIIRGVSTRGEARQRRVYNAIRVDSVPSCSWAPRGRAHELEALCFYVIRVCVCPSVRPSVHP